MFEPVAAFSGFSVDDLAKNKEFYTKTLGLKVDDDTMGVSFRLPGGGKLFMYPKENHQPASYTMLNLVVADIDKAVDELTSRGVSFEHYEGMYQDKKGIARGNNEHPSPSIAWFKDPAGNILSIIEGSQS